MNKKRNNNMKDQHYEPPKSSPQPDSTETSHLLAPLNSTKPWVRLCSVVGFIFAFFMLIAGIGLFFIGSDIPNMPFSGAVIGVIYLLMALLYFMPSLYLFQYATAIGVAQATQSMADIANALNYQKSFWKFAGIMVLVMLVIFALGIAAAIIIPAMVS